jgi:hypothetical protein
LSRAHRTVVLADLGQSGADGGYCATQWFAALGGTVLLGSPAEFPFDPEHPLLELPAMTKHLPPVPPANRSNKGTGDASEPFHDDSVKHPEPENIAEQGETANIKQNTTNKGYFHGRRMK